MTISGWILFIFLAVFIFSIGCCIAYFFDNGILRIIAVLLSVLICVGSFFAIRWYYNNTASGQRALTDQKSELNGGLSRTIKVYTADGKVIAEYEGIIDLEGNAGGYVLFDYEGKRYTYYNCFVESIAEIE